MPTNSEKRLADGISASQSYKEVENFDFDLPNLDALGVDFSLSELLVDFDLDGEGINYSCQPTLGSPGSLSGSQNESGDVNLGANQVLSEFSSTVTEFFSEKDRNIQGPDSLASVKSITKCIKILSPAKNQRSSPSDQENVSSKN
uniref:Putative DNA double-strand break repair rad50 ATPase isoform 2 n=1 Tax=Davidia involucrata TaxID=16924 RepID=A0A5B6YVR8_DAVIN